LLPNKKHSQKSEVCVCVCVCEAENFGIYSTKNFKFIVNNRYLEGLITL
jgi:hypothetical protein